jgi:hypothetical protein
VAAAAAFLQRAATLTADRTRRAHRAVAAAEASLQAGAFDSAMRLVTAAEAGPLDELVQARVDLLRAEIVFASRRGGDAPAMLLTAARRLERTDANLARASYLEALSAVLHAGRLASGVTVVEVSEAARAGPRAPDPPRPPDLLLDGLAIRFTEGYTAAAPIIKQALNAFRQEIALPDHEARWLWLASWAAADLWDEEACTLLSARQVELVREAGALTAMPIVVDARRRDRSSR